MSRRLTLLPLVLMLGACVHVKMDPIQVEATLNVNLRLDKALDDIFGDLDKKDASMKPSAKT
jgi:hypothetical protein